MDRRTLEYDVPHFVHNTEHEVRTAAKLRPFAAEVITEPKKALQLSRKDIILTSLSLRCLETHDALYASARKPPGAIDDAFALLRILIENVINIGYLALADTSELDRYEAHGEYREWIELERFMEDFPSASTVPASAIEKLEADPDVAYISLDRPVRSHAAWYSSEPVNAPYARNAGLYGTGVGIAVIDSGIASTLPDLAYAPSALGIPTGSKSGSRVLYAHNFLTDSNGNPLPTTNDQYGHGTHVAGIIAGNGVRSFGNQYSRSFAGMAPNANLIDLQVLDQNGDGKDSDVIAAIEMAITLKNTYNIRVINLSLGRPVYESYTQDPLCQAVEQAWKAGIVVVVAAGNDGRLESFNPEGYGTIWSARSLVPLDELV